MKVFEILNNTVHCEYPQYSTAAEASSHYAPTIQFVDAPDWVWPGFGFDPSKSGDERFIRPELSEGYEYDENGNIWNPEECRTSERTSRHAATTNDTMEALRKIRAGDTSIDWSAWLDTLDAYNLAIEETKNQKSYPLKVVYPDYPEKPTGGGT